VAREHGQKIAGEVGAETFGELELSYANTLLPKFKDNPLMRTIQHVLLYRDQGYLKSTCIDECIQALPNYCNVVNVTSS
jgi:hypothetical protein